MLVFFIVRIISIWDVLRANQDVPEKLSMKLAKVCMEKNRSLEHALYFVFAIRLLLCMSYSSVCDLVLI